MLDVFMHPAAGLTAAGAVWLLVAHLVGDYLLQNDWMAQAKTRSWPPAILHGVLYGLPFVLVVPSVWAWLVIAGTHVVIDRYRLAKYLVWARNQLAPRAARYPWREPVREWITGSGTAADPYVILDDPPSRGGRDNHGFSGHTPEWLASVLMFVTDNALHVVINVAAVVWL